MQTLVQSLDSLDNNTGAGPTSMKYQPALADQVLLEAFCTSLKMLLVIRVSR